MSPTLLLLTTLLAASPDAAVEREVLAASEAFERALAQRDAKALQEVLADGFVIVHSTGGLERREQYLARAAKGVLARQRTPATLESRAVQAFGRDAALELRVNQLSVGGERARMRNTATWLRRGGRWQLAATQSTRMPTLPAAVAVDAAVLARHAGRYAPPKEPPFTVALDGQALRWTGTARDGLPLTLGLFALSPTEFRLFDPDNHSAVNARDVRLRFTAEGVTRTEDGREVYRAPRAP